MSNKILDDNGKPFTSYFTEFSALPLSNTTTASFVHKAIFVGGAGDLVIQSATGGSSVLFTCPAGAWLPIQVSHVLATTTAATNIILAR